MNIKSILMLFVFSLFILSCGSEPATEEETEESQTEEAVEEDVVEEDVIEEEVIEKSIICIWQKLTVRAEPSAKGKYITSIYLGESASFSGETVTEGKKEYLKVKLKDGVEGWVESRFVAIDAVPFAVTEKTKIYKRPDVLTATKKTLEAMQYVVVLTDQDEWLEIKTKINGESWFSEGWVKASKLSKREIDVTVAILAKRALAIKSAEKKKEALNEILDNSDFNESVFIQGLEEYLMDMEKEEAIYADSLSNMVE